MGWSQFLSKTTASSAPSPQMESQQLLAESWGWKHLGPELHLSWPASLGTADLQLNRNIFSTKQRQSGLQVLRACLAHQGPGGKCRVLRSWGGTATGVGERKMNKDWVHRKLIIVPWTSARSLLLKMFCGKPSIYTRVNWLSITPACVQFSSELQCKEAVHWTHRRTHRMLKGRRMKKKQR